MYPQWVWEFLNNLLEKAGVVAVVYAVTLLGASWLARVGWKLYDAQRKEAETSAQALATTQAASVLALSEMRSAESGKRAVLREAWEKERSSTAQEYAEALRVCGGLYRDEVAILTKKLEDLHEKRLIETTGLLERVVTQVESTRTSTEKLSSALETLVEVTRRT